MEAHAATPQPDEPSGLRVGLIGAAILIGTGLFTLASRPCGGYSGVGPVLGGILRSLLVITLAFAIMLGVVALIVKGIRRLRGRPGSLESGLFSTAAIIVAFLAAIFGPLGRAQQRTNDCERSPTAHNSTTAHNSKQLTPAQSQYIAWIGAEIPCYRFNGVKVGTYDKRLTAAAKGKSPSAAEHAADEAAAAYASSARCMARLPAGNPSLEGVNRNLTAGSRLMLRAHEQYRQGIRELIAGRKGTALTEGDANVNRAKALLRSAVTEGEALYRRLGGQAALGSYLPDSEFEELDASK